MAVFLTKLAIISLSILLAVLFVFANTDFCASVFESHVDHALVGHAIKKVVVVDEFECQLQCLGNTTCKSFNVHHKNGKSAKRHVCELNNKTRQIKPGDFKWKKGSTYYGSVQVSCMDVSPVSRDQHGQRKGGECHPGYTGNKCQNQLVPPRVSLHPGPLTVVEGSDVVLPKCQVTGYPQPLVTWSKSSGQLPQGRVQFSKNVIKLLAVRKVDSDSYVCTASNDLGSVAQKTLLVAISLLQFTVKPPNKTFAAVGDTLTLNCSASGNPEPVISWKRQGAQLPLGRSQQVNGTLVVNGTRLDDAGNYTCVATSAEGFVFETTTYVDVKIGGKDCSDILKSGHSQSGEYFANPDGRGYFTVYCDMRTDGGGWTVFQRRKDGSVDFYRGWSDYKAGFGQLSGEFWLGNDKIHRLTASRSRSLRIELEDWYGNKVYAKYGNFSVGDEQAHYRLQVGSYSGTSRDSLIYHNNMSFTTKDRDNDRTSASNCAIRCTGAWWYKHCQYSNLNGRYLDNKTKNWQGVRWYHFRGDSRSFKFAEMKLRPL